MKVNHAIAIIPEVEELLNEKAYKPKRHPGIMQVPAVTLPGRLEEAMTILSKSKLIHYLIKYTLGKHLASDLTKPKSI